MPYQIPGLPGRERKPNMETGRGRSLLGGVRDLRRAWVVSHSSPKGSNALFSLY